MTKYVGRLDQCDSTTVLERCTQLYLSDVVQDNEYHNILTHAGDPGSVASGVCSRRHVTWVSEDDPIYAKTIR